MASTHAEVIRKGKVKDVYALDNQRLLFAFTDQISVFDKIIPTLIPEKGETLCRTSVHWFREAAKHGIKSHFIELRNNREFVGKRLRILPQVKPGEKNYLIPLEFIVRYYAAGSLLDRIKKGEIKPEVVGLANKNIDYGTPLPEPFFEMTTKFEAHDRPVGIEEAMEISGLGKREIEEIKEKILKIDGIIGRSARAGGLIHVDGKKEFGVDGDGEIIVVDTFGTADEDRFWDAAEYKNGKFVELSKEFVRQYYRKIGYYDELMRARELHQKEPDIPGLPEDVVLQVRDIYIMMFEKLTGEKF
ncbi:MAG: phosphoribosylaminoimidazolesuccinocarboxamide synthase [Thermoplasmata archaeon]|nr:phosphoribosylaminoimidazolesuccinocarboxamide synthase [Thermoplasmata archaeon]